MYGKFYRARRYSHLNVYGVNPGLVKTNIRSNFLGHRKFVSLSPAQYACRMTPLLALPGIERHAPFCRPKD